METKSRSELNLLAEAMKAMSELLQNATEENYMDKKEAAVTAMTGMDALAELLKRFG